MVTQAIIRSLYILAVSFLLLLVSCGRKDTDSYPNSQIIAKIGDRVITKSEFIERAEYTPRPVYCRGDNNIHKKIVLNSLIAEKLLALDLQSKPEYQTPPTLEKYVKGRKEQAMRKAYRYDHGDGLVTPTDEELKSSFKMTRREFDIGFITLPDSHYAYGTKAFIDEGESFESVYARIFGNKELESRTVTWFDDDDPVIREALFEEPVEKGQIKGPLKLKNGKYLLLKIIGWKDNIQLSKTANETIWKDMVSKVKERKGSILYNEHVAELMRGKSFELEAGTFRLVVEDLGKKYLLDESERGSMLNQAIWEVDKQHLSLSDAEMNATYKGEKLFSFDGRDWTVKEFYDLVSSHPLVFREKRFEMEDFAEQVKYAIADLLRDYVITNKAMDQGYASQKEVISTAEMWQDQYLSVIYKEIIKYSMADSTIESSNSLAFINYYMNPIVDNLQKQYSDQIYINFEVYDEIDITSVDMFVAEDHVPYPVVVPPFPQITTDHTFDYGRKLESE